MQSTSSPLPWEQPGWLDAITDWINQQLIANGRAATTTLEILHQRPWSAFAQIGTDQGIVYFKAPAPVFTHEAAVTAALAKWQPATSVSVIAVHEAEGWILTADAGPTLRQVDPTPTQVSCLLQLMPELAAFQQALMPHVDELLTLGVPDRRLEQLPTLYRALLADREALLICQQDGLSEEEYAQLMNLEAQLIEWCTTLANYGIPPTLTHEEVHDANVLYNGHQYIFTDWSDASVAHPFFSMVVVIRAAAHRLKLAEFGPEMAAVRDAYLGSWHMYGSQTELLAAYTIAYRLAMLNRALSWYNGTRLLPPEIKAPYADSVPGWLQDFLHGENR